MHRVKVRVVEDALDANNTIAKANRDDFDRHGVTVVNLMSAPGAVEDLGLGLSPALEAAVDQAIALIDETIAELRTDAAYKS